MKRRKDYLAVATIILLGIASIAGILSIDFSHGFYYTNQYGHQVELYGYGIYARDTYFKAPISIGTDICILFLLVPTFLYTYLRYRKSEEESLKLKMISVYAVSLYYGASMAFGITYNRLVLVYIMLFSCSLFGMFYHLITYKGEKTMELTKGIKCFLIISGIALFVAWLPDIIPTIISGETLKLIGNSTTEVTYVLDIGIISPVCFITIYLLARKNKLGTVMLGVMLKLCMVVGVMMIPQTVCQIASGVDLPVPVLITKSFSFVALGIFAFYFDLRLYWSIEESPFLAQFHADMEKKAAKRKNSSGVCTKKEIEALPIQMQKYCKFIGLEGFERSKAAKISFSHTDFVFNVQSNQKLDMDYELWLLNEEPERYAYCSSYLHGIPFDGIDYCLDGTYGGMKGFLAKKKQIFDVKSEQGYTAEMISWVAESAALNPTALLSKYISYEVVDEKHLKATISINGTSGSGIFTFNDEGAIVEFYSDERQVEKIGNKEVYVGWRCDFGDYVDAGGIKTINRVKAVKLMPDKEVVYFDADDFNIEYIR